MHHSVNHLITRAYVDQATTGWSTSVTTPAFLSQLIDGVGPSSMDTGRRYGPGWSRDGDDDDDDDLFVQRTKISKICVNRILWLLFFSDG